MRYAVLFLTALFPGLVWVVPADAAVPCVQLLNESSALGTFTAGQTRAYRVPGVGGLSFWLVLEATQNVTWRVSALPSDQTWLQGSAGAAEPTSVFTRPSPFATLCVQLTNEGGDQAAFALQFRRFF